MVIPDDDILDVMQFPDLVELARRNGINTMVLLDADPARDALRRRRVEQLTTVPKSSRVTIELSREWYNDVAPRVMRQRGAIHWLPWGLRLDGTMRLQGYMPATAASKAADIDACIGLLLAEVDGVRVSSLDDEVFTKGGTSVRLVFDAQQQVGMMDAFEQLAAECDLCAQSQQPTRGGPVPDDSVLDVMPYTALIVLAASISTILALRRHRSRVRQDPASSAEQASQAEPWSATTSPTGHGAKPPTQHSRKSPQYYPASYDGSRGREL